MIHKSSLVSSWLQARSRSCTAPQSPNGFRTACGIDGRESFHFHRYWRLLHPLCAEGGISRLPRGAFATHDIRTAVTAGAISSTDLDRDSNTAGAAAGSAPVQDLQRNPLPGGRASSIGRHVPWPRFTASTLEADGSVPAHSVRRLARPLACSSVKPAGPSTAHFLNPARRRRHLWYHRVQPPCGGARRDRDSNQRIA